MFCFGAWGPFGCYNLTGACVLGKGYNSTACISRRQRKVGIFSVLIWQLAVEIGPRYDAFYSFLSWLKY